MPANHTYHRSAIWHLCTTLPFLTLLSSAAFGQTPATEDTPEAGTVWEWRFQSAFWLSATSGKLQAGSGGRVRTLNSLNLDNPAPGAHVEVETRREDWRFSFDGFFFSDAGETRLRNGIRMFDLNLPAGPRLDTTLDVWSLGAGAWYRLLDHRAGGGAEDRHAMAFDLYGGGGLRLLGAEASVEVAGGPSGSESDVFIQAFLGARAELRIDETFAFTAQADIGAGLPERQFSSLHLMAGAEWRFSESVACQAGYKHLDLDVGGGDLSWDGRLAGLYAGLSFTF
jgi:opacity protein-like surface antigen